MEEMIEITKAEYDALVEHQMLLECLQAGGVDNWDWYGDAVEMFQQQLETKNG